MKQDDINADLAALDHALSMGPTPGPWEAGRPEQNGANVQGFAGVGVAWCGCNMTSGKKGSYFIDRPEAVANAHFIAACSPERIGRLLDAVKKLDALSLLDEVTLQQLTTAKTSASVGARKIRELTGRT